MCSQPSIAASGVRSSCETVDTNWSFIRAAVVVAPLAVRVLGQLRRDGLDRLRQPVDARLLRAEQLDHGNDLAVPE